MLGARGVMLLACCATLAAAALPPGYEDELYCPPGACLVKKEVRGAEARGPVAAALRVLARHARKHADSGARTKPTTSKIVASGMVGPRTLFHECVGISDRSKVRCCEVLRVACSVTLRLAPASMVCVYLSVFCSTIHTRVCMCIHTRSCARARARFLSLTTYTLAACIHTQCHTCIHACMHAYTHAYMLACMHTHIHWRACIHTLHAIRTVGAFVLCLCVQRERQRERERERERGGRERENACLLACLLACLTHVAFFF